MNSLGKQVKIVSKIDSLQGLKNYEEILQVSDAIKMDRVTLALEIEDEKVFIA